MTEPLWAWIVVIGGLLIVLAVDLWIVDRGEAREFSMRQAGGWVSFYVTLAVIFGVVLWLTLGAEKSGEFFGFFNMMGKFAAVLGPVLVGGVAQFTSDSRLSILSIAVLFVLGGGLLALVREPRGAPVPQGQGVAP